jgi:dimethylhistidine N-methyltransferase
LFTQIPKEELIFSEINSISAINQAVKDIYQEDGFDVIEGLTQFPKTLPAKYFYDNYGSDLFEKICELPEYYPTRTEASILQTHAPEIPLITGSCELVELGSGSSTKTRLLLDAYNQCQIPMRYVPIDVSEGMLKASVKRLHHEYPHLDIEGIVGTYEQALNQLSPAKLASRLIFFLGNSIGNFTPQECAQFLSQLGDVLHAGDYLLLGLDLQKPIHILEPAYNDSQQVTAAFNLNMLQHLNHRFGGNFNLQYFRHQAIYNTTENQIEMHLHCLQDHTVHLEKLALTVPFVAGETIRTEISRKFNLQQMQSQLAANGIQTVRVFTDPQQWFGLILGQAV